MLPGLTSLPPGILPTEPRQFSFAIMSGPLMWSIVAMRNQLVFHSGDKITTLVSCAARPCALGRSVR